MSRTPSYFPPCFLKLTISITNVQRKKKIINRLTNLPNLNPLSLVISLSSCGFAESTHKPIGGLVVSSGEIVDERSVLTDDTVVNSESSFSGNLNLSINMLICSMSYICIIYYNKIVCIFTIR